MNNFEVSQIYDALEYWCKLDFFSQEECPKPFSREDFQKERRKSKKSGATIGYRDRAEYDGRDSCPGDTIARRLNKLLGNEVDSRNCPFSSSTYVYFGRVPRDAATSFLAGTEYKKRVEQDASEISAALFRLNCGGTFGGLEISPILWMTHKGVGKSLPNIGEYKSEEKQWNKAIADAYESQVLSYSDIRDIAAQYVVPFFEEVKREPSGGSIVPEPLLIEYAASNQPGFEIQASLCNAYYAEDLKDVVAALRKRGAVSFESGHLPLALQYLCGGLDSCVDEKMRINLLGSGEDERSKAREFLHDKLNLETMPLGRWPSKYAPSLMQQVAINMTIGRDNNFDRFPANDIVSVNGPPGTGKTTLLKDVIAAAIVRKAELLSEYDRPDDAFEEIGLSKPYMSFRNKAKCAWRLRPGDRNEEIKSLGIIVCSSNNAAVENISKELPNGAGLLGSIGDEEKERFMTVPLSSLKWKVKGGELTERPDLYFSYAADCQFMSSEEAFNASPETYLGDGEPGLLLAARLGKRNNIKQFTSNSLEKLVFNVSAPSTKGGNASLARYREAKKAFLKQLATVEKLIEKKAAEVREREAMLSESLRQVENLEYESERLANELAANREKLTKDGAALRGDTTWAMNEIGDLAFKKGVPFSAGDIDGLHDYVCDLQEELAAYIARRNSLKRSKEEAEVNWNNSLLFKGRAKSAYLQAKEELEEFLYANRRKGEQEALLKQAEVVDDKLRSRKLSLKQLERDINTGQLRLESNKTRLEQARKTFDQVKCRMDGCIDDALAARLNCRDDAQRKAAHLFNPADDKELAEERDYLFLCALQLTREFVCASSCIREDIDFLRAYWGIKMASAEGENKEVIKFEEGDRVKLVPALFQVLNIITPVISTTFASAHRMFADVPIDLAGPAPLGLLVIDEAGQAVPYAAVGALARCRRALVVGDPYQIEPVVTEDIKQLRSKFGNSIPLQFKASWSSVQKFADNVNLVGGLRVSSNGEDETWAGCPLVVHRRCISPMFDISNEIAYGNTMLNETKTLDPQNEKDGRLLDTLLFPSSQWINVNGSEAGAKNHYVEEQGERIAQMVLASFERSGGKRRPSIFIISPFKTVVSGIKQHLGQVAHKGIGDNEWDGFIKANIGTVHTFQGKEANEVIFALGCDVGEGCVGAIEFVNANIVNVAASRAKYRLYVIGDYAAWQRNEFIASMKRILDLAWLPHWKKYCETKEESELALARLMLPHGESLPCDQEFLKDGESQPDTDSFIKNLNGSGVDLTDEECRAAGFGPLAELEGRFASCVEADGENRVLDNLKQGIKLYGLFDIGNRTNPERGEDWSFCLIMFCRSAERYLRMELLPTLKRVAPDYRQGKNGKRLAERDNLNLGGYASVFGSGHPRVTEVLATGAGAIGQEQYSSPDWWRRLSKVIDAFSKDRNGVCHADKIQTIDAEYARSLVRKLLGENTDIDVTDACHIKIMMQGIVFDAVKKDLTNQLINSIIQAKMKESDDARGASRICDVASSLALTETNVTREIGSWSWAEAKAVDGDGSCTISACRNRYDSLKEAEPVLKEAMSGDTRVRSSQFASYVLTLLEVEGYLMTEEATGFRYPTELGAARGIRWREYKDGGVGIVLAPEGQDWLSREIMTLIESYLSKR